MRFHFFRKKAQKTQEEIAAECGVDRSTVAKWETGKSIPRPEILKKLAQIFQCSIDELLD